MPLVILLSAFTLPTAFCHLAGAAGIAFCPGGGGGGFARECFRGLVDGSPGGGGGGFACENPLLGGGGGGG